MKYFITNFILIICILSFIPKTFAEEADARGLICPSGSTGYYKLVMKNISGVTEEVAKKSLKNITLGILTLGGYNLYSPRVNIPRVMFFNDFFATSSVTPEIFFITSL